MVLYFHTQHKYEFIWWAKQKYVVNTWKVPFWMFFLVWELRKNIVYMKWVNIFALFHPINHVPPRKSRHSVELRFLYESHDSAAFVPLLFEEIESFILTRLAVNKRLQAQDELGSSQTRTWMKILHTHAKISFYLQGSRITCDVGVPDSEEYIAFRQKKAISPS